MKTFLLVFIAGLLLYNIASSQVGQPAKEKEQSNIERFSSQSGTLFKREFKKVGFVGGVEFEVLTITDLLTGKKSAGVKASKEVHKSYGSSTKSCFLDYDEIDALTKAIGALKNYPTTIPVNYTEIGFTSRGGFHLSMFVSEGKWDVALKLERFDSDSYEFLTYADLDRVNNVIWDAKKFIDSQQAK